MGVEKVVITEGSGAKPSKGDKMTVHVTGYLTEGNKKFWSTHDAGQEAFTWSVGLGQVIRGWDEGCMTMCVGEKARLIMTGDYAYGAGGFPAWGIPPNAGLTFEIEVIALNDKK